MEYTSERQRETFGEDKPGLWLLTCSRAVSKQRHFFSPCADSPWLASLSFCALNLTCPVSAPREP